MDELKETIAAIVEAELEPYTHLACMAAGKAADRILSIPEIRAGLSLYLASRSSPGPNDPKPLNLGPSISTNKRKPV